MDVPLPLRVVFVLFAQLEEFKLFPSETLEGEGLVKKMILAPSNITDSTLTDVEIGPMPPTSRDSGMLNKWPGLNLTCFQPMVFWLSSPCTWVILALIDDGLYFRTTDSVRIP